MRGASAMLITSAIISGLGLGSMYGLIALGFHVTYVVSNTVNFSQGSADDAGRRAGLHLRGHARLAAAAGRRMPRSLLCALFGLLVERTLVRPFAERGSNAWLMATVAGGIVLDNAGAVHLRQGAAQLSVRARAEAGRDFRRRRLSAAAHHSGGRASRIALAAAAAVRTARAAARPCSRWCRTPTRRG